MPKTLTEIDLLPLPQGRAVTISPLHTNDFSGVRSLLGIHSYDDYQIYLDQLQEEWQQDQKLSLLVRKKANGKILAILRVEPAANGHMRMVACVHPNYQGRKKLDLAMSMLAYWCLDQGTKRVFTIAR